MKRTHIQGVDQDPSSKRRKLIPEVRDIKQDMRELAQQENWQAARRLMKSESDKVQKELILIFLKCQTKKPNTMVAANFLENMKINRNKFFMYFLQKLIINRHYTEAINWIQYRGYLTTMNTYSKYLNCMEKLANEYPVEVVQLVRKAILPDDQKLRLAEWLIRNLHNYGHDQQAINFIKFSRKINQAQLLNYYLAMTVHDIDDETANIQLMMAINYKFLNQIIADLIDIDKNNHGLDGHALLAKANKINGIKKRYKIESYTQANAIANLSEGTRMFILRRDSLFYQKNLATEHFQQIMQESLSLSKEDTEGVIEAVRLRGPSG